MKRNHNIRIVTLFVIILLVAFGQWQRPAWSKPITKPLPPPCEQYHHQVPYRRCLALLRDERCKTQLRVTPANVTVKGVRADRNQRKVIAWLMSEGHRRNLNPVVVTAAITAGTAESSLREINHGEGTSVGPFQLISIHGTRAQRRTIEFSGTWFYNHAVRAYRPGINPADLAQRVERSGNPSAYYVYLREARRTFKIASRNCIQRDPSRPMKR